MTSYVIVGAGLAGAKAAETLREEGFAGSVVLLGEEAELPYERPPLSKGLLLGSAERASVYVHDTDWYATNNVELRTGSRVTGLDPQNRTVALATGEQIGYDKLLLATGSSPRRLTVPGADHDGVYYLRTLSDSDAISAALVDGAQVVIIGAGWIGLELAAAARQRGAVVTVVETASLPLQRVLGDEVAQVFAALHRSHGVTFHFGAQVAGFTRTQKKVLLADGTELAADVVIVGVGIQPNVELAQQAGLHVDNGIVCDETQRTSDPNIWAAGDVASTYHPLLQQRIRVEHWSNALNGGPAAARAMLGDAKAYDHLPYFFTDQYDLGMEHSGWVAPGEYDNVEFRGDPASLEFVVFWMKDGRILAGMNVNVWDIHDDIRALVTAGLAGERADLGSISF
jgi:NADPH-dependent 2,4-dienoyl-CoA reductase/sulfur reductase-like enzyme